MDSDEDLDFNDDFEEKDNKQYIDELNEDQSNGSDSDDNLYFDKKQDNLQKQVKKIIDDDDGLVINDNNDTYNYEQIDYMDLLNKQDDNELKNTRQNFLNIIKNTKDDDTIMKLIEERQSVGRTSTQEDNPNIIKDQEILERMLQKKKKYDEIMFEREKLEFLKKTRKIRQNPEEYRNFMKCFVLCDVASTFYYLQSHLDNDLLKSIIISQFSKKDLDFLLSMYNQPEKYSTNSIIRTVNYHIQQYFVYKWKKEQVDLIQNLDVGNEVGYSQFNLIAFILFEYIGLKVRFSKIVDMRYLNLDKKHNQRIKDSKRNSNQNEDSNQVEKKRTRETIVNNVIAQKKPTRFSDMASRITNNLMMKEDDSNKSEDSEDEYVPEKRFIKFEYKESQKENQEFFDAFMTNFKYEKKNNPCSKSLQSNTKNDEDSLLSTASSIGQANMNAESNKFDFRKYLKKYKNDTEMENSQKIKNQQKDEDEEEIILVKKDLLKTKSQDQKPICINQKYFKFHQFQFKIHQQEKKMIAEDEEDEQSLNPFTFAYSKKKSKVDKKDEIQTQETKPTENVKDRKQNGNKKLEAEVKSKQNGNKSDFYQSSEIKFWLEVYDEKTQSWICFDAVQNQLLEKFQILLKQNGMPILFIIGYNRLEFKNENLSKYIHEQRSMKNMFLSDITDIHCERYPRVQVSRRDLNLDFWWKKLLQHVSFLGDPDLLDENYQQQVINERNLKFSTQSTQIPQNYPEFKASEIFITKSMILKYQGLHPDSQKTGFTFKDEEVYFKKYVVELHAKTRWRTLKRSVIKGEAPIKQVQSILGQQKMVDLYGEWQTEELIYKIGEDGSLPRNEYGNWETFAVDPPEGTVLIDLPGLPKLLKKQDIEYVEAVSGFEQTTAGRSHVVKKGILAHSRDEERIRQIYSDNYEIIKAQQSENLRRELMGLWRKVFKGVLLKKSISERTNKILS